MSLRKGNTLISGAGTDGTNGQDGFSPTASVSKSGSVSTLTVTDANGTTTTEILDGGQIIQYVTMPTASSENVGDIVQYTGTTTSNYTNGYFYKCVNNNSTYSWQSVAVQYIEDKPIRGLHNEVNNTITHSYFSVESSIIFNYLNNIIDTILECINDVYDNYYILNKNNYFILQSSQSSIRNCVILLPSPIENGTGSIQYYETTIDKEGNTWKAYRLGKLTFTNYKVTSLSLTATFYTTLIALGTNNDTSYTPTTNSYNPATAIYAEKMVESLAPVYSSSSTYDIGDYVSYQGKLYVCNTTISSAEAWTSAHWTETTVMQEILNLINH